MAKIDCSVTANFLKEWRRYCGGRRCGYCDLSEHNECGFPACQVKDFPEKAVDVIQKWSDEHPVKTRLDDLLEKYPKTYISNGNTPSIRPYMLGYCENCDDCVYSHCETEVCWHEPLVGGATGKAV
jgi:hypothetical protein